MNEINTGGVLEGWRLRVVSILVLTLFAYYAYRLFTLQVLEGESYAAQATENRTTRISVPAQRGIIYDRNGVVLARNVPSFNVVITPANLPGLLPFGLDEVVPGEIQEVYRQLSRLVDVPVSSGTVDENTVFTPCLSDLGIKQIVYIGDTTSPYDPVRVKCNIAESIARQIQERSADLPGVSIEVEPVRDYPTGELTAEIIGFLGPVPANQEGYYREKGFVPGRDKVGYAGVENTLQDILGGTNGERYVEVDVAGKELRELSEPVDAIAGNNVTLTIDIRLQMAARESLTSWIDYWNLRLGMMKANSGVVIAMNPKTGEVLSLVSFPSYENNRMARIIPAYYYQQLSEDPLTPLLNKAISAEFPPGSVFKMPIAIGALNERVVTPEFEVDDPGLITVEEKPLPNSIGTSRQYVCWNRTGHGQVDWLTGVKESCDVYFYKIGGGYRDQVKNGGLGIWRLGEYSRALGYGESTGIELPGEADGLIPNPDWKRIYQGQTWTIGDTYIASMGQSFVLSTPLQVLVSAAILANDGKYLRPTLVNEISDSDGNIVKPFEPELKWDITKDALIHEYDENSFQTGALKTVEPWIVALAKRAMRLVVTEGTALVTFNELVPLEQQGILTAGKTGTAEYCDKVAWEKGICNPGEWPQHSWYFGYAPYDDPEIAVVAFVYNGGEGASVAGPIVGEVIQTYFELKAIDAEKGGSSVAP
jgi:penicillin-binding protein 2